MIDWIKSAELNECTIGDLETRFRRFPQSNKEIVWNCDVCDSVIETRFADYNSGLCNICSKQTPEVREAARLKTIEQFSDPSQRDAARIKSIEQWSDQAAIDEMSEIVRNSVAHKAASLDQVGGYDIVGHHMIYDESDLTKHIMKMTRSMHTTLHNLFRKHGIEIPHINTNNRRT